MSISTRLKSAVATEGLTAARKKAIRKGRVENFVLALWAVFLVAINVFIIVGAAALLLLHVSLMLNYGFTIESAFFATVAIVVLGFSAKVYLGKLTSKSAA